MGRSERNQKMSENPTVNRLSTTKSQRLQSTILAHELPCSKYYRKQLVPLLNKKVVIRCREWEIKTSKGHLTILMKNAELVKPKTLHPIQVEHIWTIVDDGWFERNKNCLLGKEMYLYCSGFLYEYERKGVRNIGIKAINLYYKEP